MCSRYTADLFQTLSAVLGISLSWLRTVKDRFYKMAGQEMSWYPRARQRPSIQVTKVGHFVAGAHRAKMDLTHPLGVHDSRLYINPARIC